MAMAIAANACDGPSTVRGWRAIASSYPGFAADLGSVTE
jgi:5-enolpyruvylshikimate-3-phosphate synthase